MSAAPDRTSWSVQDEAVHEELAALMDLTDDDIRHLTALLPSAEDAAADLSSAFYDRLLAHEATAEYFDGEDMDARHRMVEAWFTDIFAGDYGSDYVRDRLRIGEVHVQIGLPVRYPLAMLDVVLRFGETVAQDSDHPDAAARAFRKALSLDIAVFNHAYEHNQLKHLAELVGGERLARRLLMGGMNGDGA
jgi:hypothetical protein